MSKLYSREDEIKYRRLLKKLVNIKDLLTIEEQYLLCNYNIHLEQEIEKRDNIINEFEKWLEESAKYEPYEYNGILDKLKELKEGK